MSTATTNQNRTRCEVWTRVMGYHRPVSQFNIGKKSEHYSRKPYVACISANQAFSSRYGTACESITV